jgi:hypothetical protein
VRVAPEGERVADAVDEAGDVLAQDRLGVDVARRRRALQTAGDLVEFGLGEAPPSARSMLRDTSSPPLGTMRTNCGVPAWEMTTVVLEAPMLMIACVPRAGPGRRRSSENPEKSIASIERPDRSIALTVDSRLLRTVATSSPSCWTAPDVSMFRNGGSRGSRRRGRSAPGPRRRNAMPCGAGPR